MLYRRFMLILALTLLIGCSSQPQPVTNQHPAWACNSSYLGPLAGGIAALVTSNPVGLISAVSIGVNACEAEASLVNGPPAQITQTTTTVQGMTGMANPQTLTPAGTSLAQPKVVTP